MFLHHTLHSCLQEVVQPTKKTNWTGVLDAHALWPCIFKATRTHETDILKKNFFKQLPKTKASNADKISMYPQTGQNNKWTVLHPTKHKPDRTEQQTNSPPPYQTQTRSDRTTSEQSSTLQNINTIQIGQNNKWTVLHPTKHKHWSGGTEQQVNSPPPDKKQTLIRSDWTSEQPSKLALSYYAGGPAVSAKGRGNRIRQGDKCEQGKREQHTHKQPQASRAPTDDLQPCFSQSWRYQSSPSEHRDTRSHHLQSNLTPVCSAHVPQSEMMLQAFETNKAFKVSPSVQKACWF